MNSPSSMCREIQYTSVTILPHYAVICVIIYSTEFYILQVWNLTVFIFVWLTVSGTYLTCWVKWRKKKIPDRNMTNDYSFGNYFQILSYIHINYIILKRYLTHFWI